MSTLIKSNFFPSLRSMMEDFWDTDRFFNPAIFRNNGMPAVNIRDTEQQYEIEVSAPGFKKDDFKIAIDRGMITISAESMEDKKEEKDDYTRREFLKSSFSRTFTLPDNVVEDDIKACYKEGLLNITLKKSGKAIGTKKQVLID